MTKQMMQVYGTDLKRIAILQNAFSIKEEQQINQIYSLSFNMPSTDDKMRFCQPFTFYRFGDGKQMYRQIKNPKQNSDVSIDTVTCEHAIATLCDNVMFGAHTVGGKDVKTREVIEYILSFQSEPIWALGDCDFEFEYEYNWEQENLLNALYSVPKVFVDPYIWTFDFSRVPWHVNLKKIDPNSRPEYYIRAKNNLISDSAEIDYSNICTRLYPLGYGEGINQLTIKDVNNDVPYLEAPASVIAKYGIKEKVLVDRKFEDAETLKAYAQTVLDAMVTPALTRKFNVVDLYPITGETIDNAEVGKLCKLTEDGTITYVTKTTRVLDDPGNLQIDLSTKATDVVAQLADLADRVRIESVYAQGATQIYQHAKDANATKTKGMVLSLYFPAEMKQINKVLLRMKLNKFRSYSQTTEAGGGTIETGQVTGIGEPNVSFDGYASSTTEAQWTGSSAPYAQDTVVEIHCNSAGDHTHNLWGYTGSTTPPASDNYRHNHGINISSGATSAGSHRHGIEADAHSHSIPRWSLRHYHNLDIDVINNTTGLQKFQHTHPISLEPHTHSIKAGIYETGNPSGFYVLVNGDRVYPEGCEADGLMKKTSWNDDITMWLLGSDGLVPRNQWIDMEIRPNDNAYVVASVFVQGFVQSRGGGNY